MAKQKTADFELIVGADVALSTKQLRSDLKDIFANIEQEVPSIKLKFDIDNSELKKTLSELSSKVSKKEIKLGDTLNADGAIKGLGSADQHLQSIARDLTAILGVVKEISGKSMSLNFGNMFKPQALDTSASKAVLKEYLQYISRVQEDITIFTKEQARLSKTARGNVTSAIRNVFSGGIFEFSEIDAQITEEIKKAESIVKKSGSRQTTIDDEIKKFKEFVDIYNKLYNAFSEKGLEIEAPSTEGIEKSIEALEEAKQRNDELNAQIKEQGKQYRENLANGGSNAMGSLFGGGKQAAQEGAAVVQQVSQAVQGVTQIGKAAASAITPVNALKDTIKTIEIPLKEMTDGKLADVKSSLTSMGIADRDANTIADSLKNVNGQITKLKVNYKDFGDDEERVSSVLVKATDGAGRSFAKLIEYQRRVHSDGSVTWKPVSSGVVEYTLATEKAAASTEKLVNIK